MLKFFVVLLTVFCFTAAARNPAVSKAAVISKLAKHNMTQELLLDKMKKAVDPADVAKTWKTMIIKMQMTIPMQQIKMDATATCKFPDKMKTVFIIPGMPTLTEVFDGGKAWKETAGLGIQMKTGILLAFAKFECRKANPALTPAEIYEKVTLDPYLYKIGEFSCYKLICTLPEELNVPPTQAFIDNNKFLIRRSIENQLTDMGVISVSIDLSDYKVIKGIKTPMLMDMNMLGIKMAAKIISVKVNEEIADSEFKFPENK